MQINLFSSLKTGLIFLSIHHTAISADITSSCVPHQAAIVTVTEVALPLMLTTAFVSPFLAGFSNTSPEIALASAAFNTFSLIMPILNAGISWQMESHADHLYSSGQTCGVVPIVSTFRNLLGMGLTIGATATSWLQYQNENDQLYAANITLTTVSSVITIGGTSLMYYCLYPGFKEHNNIKSRYSTID